jgi:hypothetical protein
MAYASLQNHVQSWASHLPDEVHEVVSVVESTMWLCLDALFVSPRMSELKIAFQAMCEWTVDGARVISRSDANNMSVILNDLSGADNAEPFLATLPESDREQAKSALWTPPLIHNVIDPSRWPTTDAIFAPTKARIIPTREDTANRWSGRLGGDGVANENNRSEFPFNQRTRRIDLPRDDEDT